MKIEQLLVERTKIMIHGEGFHIHQTGYPVQWMERGAMVKRVVFFDPDGEITEVYGVDADGNVTQMAGGREL